jgi:ribose transport system permease protein
MQNTLRRLRYRWSLQQFVAELLDKPWMEPAAPFALLLGLLVYFGLAVPSFSNADNVQSMLREIPEFLFVCAAMGVVLISGGIDLSVGAIFGLTNFVALMLVVMVQMPVPLAILCTLLVGCVLGAFNGFVVAYLKGRPFLSTLVTLIIYQAITNLLAQRYSPQLAVPPPADDIWTWLGSGSVLGLPSDVVVLIALLVVGHIVLSRSRPGWHVVAVGSSRRAARHAGIKVERVLFSTYVLSGLLCAIGGIFIAARLDSASSSIGQNLQFIALTAVVLGGVSLLGGRGTVGRILIGGLAIFILNNGLLQMNVTGYVDALILAVILLLAVGVDTKWGKNRSKAIQKIYLNPTLLENGPLPDISAEGGGAYAVNPRLANAEAIGLGQVEGPEDVILDRQGRLYCGDRRGWIMRFSGPRFEECEVFARIGGMPLGLAFDRDQNLIVCVGGMGLYAVDPEGKVSKVTDETNRTWYKLKDDSRLRLADDLDIMPDGTIYFSEATVRFEATEWILDGLEGRPNGRLIRYDPKTRTTRTVVRNMVFPNGVCCSHDGQSVLVAQTWLCRIVRYWHAGPKKGKVEPVIDNLPGYPDNINRASDGSYWVALTGLRTPCFDLAYRMPGFRRRMIKQIPPDEWLYPNMNNGCVVKLTESGTVVESYWDPGGDNHATITSMREKDGYLYIGGLHNNRVGRILLTSTASADAALEPVGVAGSAQSDHDEHMAGALHRAGSEG